MISNRKRFSLRNKEHHRSPSHKLTCFIVLMALSLVTDMGWAQTAVTNSQVSVELQQGQAALQANDQATAAEHFRAVLKLDPANPEAHANLGVIAFFHGNCTVAESEFQSTLRVAPNLINAQALLSICERRLGQPAAQSDMEAAYARLEDLKLKTQVGIELADVYYQHGELGKTASLLHEMLLLNPDNVDLLFFAQRVYSELADNTLNKLAVLAPGSARMEQLIAERLINAGDLKSAAAHYRKAIELNPKLPGMHYELAETMMEASPNDATTQAQSKSELQAAINSDGDNSRIESLMGKIALLQDNKDEALAHYKRANELNAGDVQSQIGLAALLEAQDNHEQAAIYLRKAVAADPFNAQAHYKLAQIDKELHLTEEQKHEMNLFVQIRAEKDKIRRLYQQMNPAPADADAKPAQAH